MINRKLTDLINQIENTLKQSGIQMTSLDVELNYLIDANEINPIVELSNMTISLDKDPMQLTLAGKEQLETLLKIAGLGKCSKITLSYFECNPSSRDYDEDYNDDYEYYDPYDESELEITFEDPLNIYSRSEYPYDVKVVVELECVSDNQFNLIDAARYERQGLDRNNQDVFIKANDALKDIERDFTIDLSKYYYDLNINYNVEEFLKAIEISGKLSKELKTNVNPLHQEAMLRFYDDKTAIEVNVMTYGEQSAITREYENRYHLRAMIPMSLRKTEIDYLSKGLMQFECWMNKVDRVFSSEVIKNYFKDYINWSRQATYGRSKLFLVLSAGKITSFNKDENYTSFYNKDGQIICQMENSYLMFPKDKQNLGFCEAFEEFKNKLNIIIGAYERSE